MIKQTGANYLSGKFAKSLIASDSKVGKSCFLIAGALGMLPWQKTGGIVDKPENLHVITFDSNALGGVKKFLLETCGAPAESLNFQVYNMQQDLMDAASSDREYNYEFLHTLKDVENKITQAAKGVPAVLVSSLTGLAEGVLAGIRGPTGEKKGGGMDMSKWGDFAAQITEVRNRFQVGPWHTLWEAHILKMQRKGQGTDSDEESLQIPGKSGTNFFFNVEEVFRLRRQFGQTYKPANGTPSKCELAYLDTKPSFAFISGGRNFTESLEPKEYDITSVFQKLGRTVGNWGAK